jgi:hypothetical protein
MRLPLGFPAITIAPGETGETSTTLDAERFAATRLVAGTPVSEDAAELVDVLIDDIVSPYEWSALSGANEARTSSPSMPVHMRKGQRVTVRLKNRGETPAPFFVTMLGNSDDVTGVPLRAPLPRRPPQA